MRFRLSKVQKQQIIAECDIVQGRKAKLNPRDVLQFARSHKRSQFHKLIDWDNRRCAERDRLSQIRLIIAAAMLEESKNTVRTFTSLTIDRYRGGGYRKVREVLDTPNLLEVYLQDALEELNRIRIKYQHIKKLASVWDAIKRETDRAQRTGTSNRRRTNGAENRASL